MTVAALTAAAVLASLAPGEVAACIGRPGSGKTTTAMQALDAAPWGARTVVFDPYAVRDRANYRAGHRDRLPWWPSSPCLTVDQLLENVSRAARNGRASLLDAPRLRLVVAGTRGTLERGQLGRDFSTLVQLLWHTHGWALVGEECGLYSRDCAEAINRVATGGAHAGMRLVLLCQRLGRIQKDAREGLGVIVAGAQGAVEDLADLRERCGPAFAARVRAIRPPQGGRPGDLPVAWRLGDGLHGAGDERGS